MGITPQGGLVFLYTVTTVTSGYSNSDKDCFTSKRTPVICSTFEKARGVIDRNDADIHEGSYTYAVIERIVPDWIYPETQGDYQQWWFKWEGNLETGKYEPCPAPPEYARIIGFGIIG